MRHVRAGGAVSAASGSESPHRSYGTNDDNDTSMTLTDVANKIKSSLCSTGLGQSKEKQVLGNWRKEFTKWASFQLVIGFAVVLNAVVLGAEADYGEEMPTLFKTFEYTFCVIFTLELGLHFLCEGIRAYFRDAMNWFDFVLVMLSIFDVVLALAGLEVGNMKELAVLRMLRLIRLARLVRLFRIFRELTLLLSGLLSSVKTLSWALLFLAITVYIFAIFARLVIGKASTCGENEDGCDARTSPLYEFNPEIGDQDSIFGTVDKTMLSLFVCLTEGCGFDIMRPVAHESPILTAFWVFFICFTTFGVLNLICGIICEQSLKAASASEAAILESRDQDRQQTLNSMAEIFQIMDADQSGTVSHEEFLQAIKSDKHVANAFIELGLQREENLYEKLDANKTNDVTFDQFFDGIFLIMKGHETAKAKDLVRTHLLCQTLTKKAQAVAGAMGSLRRRHHLRVTDARTLREAAEVVVHNMRDLNARLVGLSDRLQVIRSAIENGRATTMGEFSATAVSSSTPVKPQINASALQLEVALSAGDFPHDQGHDRSIDVVPLVPSPTAQAPDNVRMPPRSL